MVPSCAAAAAAASTAATAVATRSALLSRSASSRAPTFLLQLQLSRATAASAGAEASSSSSARALAACIHRDKPPCFIAAGPPRCRNPGELVRQREKEDATFQVSASSSAPSLLVPHRPASLPAHPTLKAPLVLRRGHTPGSQSLGVHPPEQPGAEPLADKQSRKAAARVTWIGAFGNVGLAITKFVAGTLSGSSALLADAAHSLSDLLSDAVTLIVVDAARRPPNERHPYGHGRYEAVGSLSVALVLVATAGGCAWSSAWACLDFWSGTTLPSVLDSGWGAAAVGACVLSLVTKETLYHMTVKVGNEVQSQTLIANAWHHRSDSLSSVAALVGVAGGMAGMPWLDPASGLVVSVMVAKAGVEIGYEALQEVMERASPDTELREAVEIAAAETEGVACVTRLRTRKMGPYSLVDLRIEVDPHLSMSAAHNIARHLQTHVHTAVPNVSEVLVHIAPSVPATASSPMKDPSNSFKNGEQLCHEGRRLLRPHAEVEKEVRESLQSIPEIRGVSDVITYYVPNEGIRLKVDIICDEELVIRHAVEIARKAEKVLAELPDVLNVDVDLELFA